MPSDLDLHCLQRQDISGFSRTECLWSLHSLEKESTKTDMFGALCDFSFTAVRYALFMIDVGRTNDTVPAMCMSTLMM